MIDEERKYVEFKIKIEEKDIALFEKIYNELSILSFRLVGDLGQNLFMKEDYKDYKEILDDYLNLAYGYYMIDEDNNKMNPGLKGYYKKQIKEIISNDIFIDTKVSECKDNSITSDLKLEIPEDSVVTSTLEHYVLDD